MTPTRRPAVADLPLSGGGKHRPLRRDEWRAIAALLVLFVPNTLFWACYEQIGNTTILWIDADIDRSIGLFGSAARIPTTWFLAFNPFMIFAFTPFVVALWARQAARGSEPSTVTKMALGCFGVTAANLIMGFAAFHAGAGQASWLWLLGSIAVITVGELYLSPVGLSLVTKVAPVRLLSMMMGIWLATSFTGGFLAGLHRQLLEPDAAYRIFPDDRRHRRLRRPDDPRLPPAAEGGAGGVVSVPPRESGEGGPRSCAVGGARDSTLLLRRQRSVESEAPSTCAERAVPLPRFVGADATDPGLASRSPASDVKQR